jgi:hypothetical protein
MEDEGSVSDEWDAYMTPIEGLRFPEHLVARPDDPAQWWCPIAGCRHVYRRLQELRVHTAKKHPDVLIPSPNPRSTKVGKAFPCPVATCPSGFMTKADFRHHWREKHRPKREDVLALAARLRESYRQ